MVKFAETIGCMMLTYSLSMTGYGLYRAIASSPRMPAMSIETQKCVLLENHLDDVKRFGLPESKPYAEVLSREVELCANTIENYDILVQKYVQECGSGIGFGEALLYAWAPWVLIGAHEKLSNDFVRR
ncbi:TPA: hypothetical protein HA251_08745 [Candidatus Woesearchaeota archaeon]|nr:hypothetical protein [Candidatus Woesearchaeota archaeon]